VFEYQTNFYPTWLSASRSCFRCSSLFRGGKIIVWKKVPKGTVSKLWMKKIGSSPEDGNDDFKDPKGGLCIAGVFGGVGSLRFRPNDFYFLESPIFLRISSKRAQFHGFEDGRLFSAIEWHRTGICSLCIEKGSFICKNRQDRQIGFWTNRFDTRIQWKFSNWSSYGHINRLDRKENRHRRKSKEFCESLEIQGNRETGKSDLLQFAKPYRVDVTPGSDVIEEYPPDSMLREVYYQKIFKYWLTSPTSSEGFE